MSRNQIIEDIEAEQLKQGIPDFYIGDTVKVQTKIIEGNKERVQSITGTVIARKGKGLSETFSIYRIAYGAAMERVFPLHSPRLSSIEVVKSGKVRRSKLYYIRGVFGKKAKIQEYLGRRKTKAVVEKEAKPSAQETKQPETPKNLEKDQENKDKNTDSE